MALVLLCIAGLIAYRMIPIKVKTAELRDTVYDASKSAGQMNDRQIHGTIFAKAKQLELPVAESDIVVKRSPNYIRVDVNYTVPVEFPGYTYNWKFAHHTENPVF